MGNHSLQRLLAAAGLVVVVGGLLYAISSGVGDDDSSATPETPTTPVATPPPATPRRPRPAPFVRLAPAGAFDPEGDGRERDEEAGLAVDGRPSTSWRTERYSNFFKSGVGLVLDAGRRVRVERVVVVSPTTGGRAEIRLGDSPDGPFAAAAPARTLGGTTTFRVPRRAGRYVVVWVVAVPDGSATEIAEVRVRARR